MPRPVRPSRPRAAATAVAVLCVAAGCVAAAGRDAGAQTPTLPARSADGYVTLRGADTVVFERVARDAAGETVSEVRLGRAAGANAGVRLRTRTTARPDGATARVDAEVTPPGVAGPPQRVSIVFGPGDSATVRAGDGPPQRVAATAGAVAFTEFSLVPFEHLVRRARALGGAVGRPVSVPVLIGARTLPAAVSFPVADSALVTVGAVTVRLAVTADGRALGFVVPAQRARAVRVDPASVRVDPASVRADAGAASPVDYAAPPGAPYTAEAVRVATPGGFTLAGTLTLPGGAGPARRAPVVVTITGSGPQDRDGGMGVLPGYRPFAQLADTLARRGIGVLRLDDRGVGASGGAATLATFTTRDVAADVRAALAWLRTVPEVDAARVALLGHSEGGVVGPMVAADDPAVAAVVVMAGPSRPGREVSGYQQREAIARAMPGAPPAAVTRAYEANQPGVRDALAASAWLRFWWDHDPLPAARRVRAPVLVLQGATDRQVPAAHAAELADAVRAGGNRDVTVRVFPATNHLFVADTAGAGDAAGYRALPSLAVRPEVLGAAADWLAARLRAGAR
jgi:dienelactone hydrolase